MEKKISIIIPYYPETEYVRTVSQWSINRIRKNFENYDLIVETVENGSFNKCRCINMACKKAKNEYILILDPVLIFDINEIKDAIKNIENHEFIVISQSVCQLDKEKTKKVISMSEDMNPYDTFLVDEHEEVDLVSPFFIISKSRFVESGELNEFNDEWGTGQVEFIQRIQNLYSDALTLNKRVWRLYENRVVFITYNGVNINLITKYNY